MSVTDSLAAVSLMLWLCCTSHYINMPKNVKESWLEAVITLSHIFLFTFFFLANSPPPPLIY